MKTVHICFNGEIMGPFGAEEVTSLIRAGKVPSSLLAWHEGMDGWLPIKKIAGFEEVGKVVTEAQQVEEARMRRKRGTFTSKFGIFSLAMGVLAILIWVPLVLVAKSVGNVPADSSIGSVLLVVIPACCVLNGLGLIVGLVGLHPNFKGRKTALAGVSINIVAIVVGIGGLLAVILF